MNNNIGLRKKLKIKVYWNNFVCYDLVADRFHIFSLYPVQFLHLLDKNVSSRSISNRIVIQMDGKIKRGIRKKNVEFVENKAITKKLSKHTFIFNFFLRQFFYLF